MINLAKRLELIKPSVTLEINAKAKKLKAEGVDVIILASGEPDFAPADHILTAAKQAIDDGYHYYTAVDGLPSLKNAVINKFAMDNQLSFTPEQIIIGTGGKQCIYNALQAVLNEGDEVIIPSPYWVSYPDMVALAGGVAKIVETTNITDFKLNADQLASSINANTKLLILNSPSNPTGAIYSEQELQAIADVLRAHPHVMILSDDIYEKILWNQQRFVNLAMIAPDLMDRTLIINGVSKAYAMTGWRIGYAAGPSEVIKGMKKIQSQSTSNPTAIAQIAAVSALSGDQAWLDKMVDSYHQRQQLVQCAINNIDGLQLLPTQGAFYAFVEASNVISRLKLRDDIALVNHLLDQAKVAVVPGTAFGAPGYFRLSFATSDELLKKALARIAACLSSNG